MGNWNQDSSGLSDEDMDQSLQQDIAAANFAASGGDLGNYTFGGNFVNDADNPGYTGTSTNMNQAVADMQGLFNSQRGITASNPYGKEGFFSRVFGIDPSKIDYSGNMDLNTRMGIASNQFSKYMNPQNVKGQIGYNPAYDTAEKGKLRAGVQDENYQTVYGPVMEQARKQGTGEMLARGAMGLFGGPVGMALAQLGTKEYGLPGVTGFDSFDPNNPNPGGGILGQFLGGLNPTQAKEALVGAFAPVAPAPTPTQIGSVTPSQYETRADIIGRTSQNPLNSWSVGRDAAKKQALSDAVSSVMNQAQTSPSIANLSLEDKKAAINELAEKNYQSYLDAMPDIGSVSGQRISTVSTTGGIDAATAKKADEIFGPSSLSYDFYTDPQAGGTYPSAMAGEQLAGIFGENPKAAGFRSLGESIKSIINKENLPDNQNMYGPGMPDQTPLTPDELNDILAPSGMELGRGPATANQLAFDTTGMTRYGNSYVGNNYGIMDKAASSIPGLADTLRSMGIDIATPPTAKIYSSPTSSNAFSRLIGR